MFRTHMNEKKEVNRLSGLLAMGSSYLPHHPCYLERYSFQATESKERCQTGETGPGEGSRDKDEGVKSFQSKVRIRLGSCSCPQAPSLSLLFLGTGRLKHRTPPFGIKKFTWRTPGKPPGLRSTASLTSITAASGRRFQIFIKAPNKAR